MPLSRPSLITKFEIYFAYLFGFKLAKCESFGGASLARRFLTWSYSRVSPLEVHRKCACQERWREILAKQLLADEVVFATIVSPLARSCSNAKTNNGKDDSFCFNYLYY